MTEYNKMLTSYRRRHLEVVRIIDEHDRYFKALIQSLRDELSMTRAVLTAAQKFDINQAKILFN